MNEQIYIIQETEQFSAWLKKLRDPIAKAAVLARIKRSAKGNFGDFKSLGQGVYEMRIACGAGYRIYYAQTGQMIYLLLWGGDKSSQSQDIEKAYFLWQKLKTGE